MQSKASTVHEYLGSLPEDRRRAIARVRQIIRKNLPRGYVETMNWGMISYELPLKAYPGTYNGQPLLYAALASQKNHMAVYLTGIYGDPKLAKLFEAEYKKTGKRYDVGKSCVRFRSLDDLPLVLIGKTIRALPPKKLIALYENAQRSGRKKKTPSKK